MNQSRPNAEDVVVKDGDGGAHPPPLIDRTDLGLAVFILAVCGYLYWVTTGFDSVADMFAQDVPPEFFPRLLLWTIAVLTLGLPFEHLLLRKKGESLDEERAVRVKPIAYKTAALLLIVVVSIPWLGTTLSMAAAGLTIPVLWGERRIKVLVPYAIILPLGVTFVFSYLLGVYFEPGKMTIRRRFTGDFKAKVALEALRGDKTIQEIAARHKVHPNQVSTWKRQAMDGLGTVFSNGPDKARIDHDDEVHDLHAKIDQLTVERDFLAKGLKR